MTLSKMTGAYLKYQTSLIERIISPIDRLFSNTAQRKIIISAIALSILASSQDYLPGELIVAAKMLPIQMGGSMLLAGALLYFGFKPADQEYADALASVSPFFVSVAGPLVEELQFRIILQNTSEWLITKMMPAFSYTALASIFIASSLFGSMHYFNSSKGHLTQAIVACFPGMVLGNLYYQYGFAASFFAHCMNNFIAEALVSLKKPSNAPTQTPAAAL